MLQQSSNPPQITPVHPARAHTKRTKKPAIAAPVSPSMDELAFACDRIAALILQDYSGVIELGDGAETALIDRLCEIRDRATEANVSTAAGATFAILLASSLIDRTINGSDLAERQSAKEDVEKLLYAARDFFGHDLARLPAATEYLMPERCDPRKTKVSADRQPRTRVQSSPAAFDVIDASIMPIDTDSGDNLLDALCCMKDENDVVGMIELYQAYVGIAERLMVAGDRANDRAGTLLDADCNQAWAKAYLVADFLKEMRPTWFMAERYAQTLFAAAIQMGGTLQEAAAVVAEVAKWDLDRSLPPSTVKP